MGWRPRKNTDYLYRSKRVAGRVVTEYVGRGRHAELVAEQDARRRVERAEQAARFRTFRAELSATDRVAAGRFKMVQAIVAWALERAGFHRHDRGSWRRKRMAVPAAEMDVPVWPFDKPTVTRQEVDDLPKLFEAATTGDETAMGTLRKFFDAEPADWLQIACAYLARNVEDRVIKVLYGQNLLFSEGLRRNLAAMRAELEGQAPSALERLLVERVVACWLDLQVLELQHAARAAELSPAAVLLLDRRRTSANRRYLAALKTLASVRKLGLPTTAIQVNVGLVAEQTGPPAIAATTVEALPARELDAQPGHSFRPRKGPGEAPETAANRMSTTY